jgi:hypothetical protein
MKTILVPEKFVAEYLHLGGLVDAAQGKMLEARIKKDDEALNEWGAATVEAVAALGALMKRIWGRDLQSLLQIQGGSPVHTSYQMEPPAMVVYESEEEYLLDVEREEKACKESGDTFLHVHHLTGLKRPEAE